LFRRPGKRREPATFTVAVATFAISAPRRSPGRGDGGAYRLENKPPSTSSAPATMPAMPSHVGIALSCVAVSLAEPSWKTVSVCV
jgi:hypothetical protein